jgi:molybdopterin synthase sulfur carrier subunit
VLAKPAEESVGDRRVCVRYFAGARDAAGLAEEILSLPPDAEVGHVLRAIAQKHGGRLARILDSASFLLDGVAVRDTTKALPGFSQLDVLPPFAGG